MAASAIAMGDGLQQRCADYTTSERLSVSETHALSISPLMMICPTDRQESHQAVVAHQLTGKGEMIYVEVVELTLT